jgi:hypothetical protein
VATGFALRDNGRGRRSVAERCCVGGRSPLARREHPTLCCAVWSETHETNRLWHVIEYGLHAATHEIGFVPETSSPRSPEESAAQRPTVPSPTQSGMLKPKAPGARGIETGTPLSIAAVMIGFSRKSHIFTTCSATRSARSGFLSIMFLRAIR